MDENTRDESLGRGVSVTVIIVLCLFISGLTFYLYRQQVVYRILSDDYVSIQQDYLILQERYTSLESEHDSLNSKYSVLQSEHDRTVSEYTSLNQDHDSLKQNYDALQTEYQNLSEQHDILVGDYEAIYTSRYEEGYGDGYTQGVTDGVGRGYNVRDPTYKEALEFVSSDETDINTYVDEEYTCVNFAGDFKNNAFIEGYRCGLVYIEFTDSAHSIVCFNTTDEGLIFVEPQDDELVTLTVGQPYYDRTRYEITFDDTVIRFIIVW